MAGGGQQMDESSPSHTDLPGEKVESHEAMLYAACGIIA